MKASLLLKIIACFIIQSCNTNKPASTTLNSDDFDDKSERIAVLKKEIKVFSEINDAEFQLINANGFSNQRNSVPGASSWIYHFAIKVDTNDVYKWTAGMIEIPNSNTETDWIDMIPGSRKQNWQLQSAPKVYTRNDSSVTMFVYKHEGIIYKEIIRN